MPQFRVRVPSLASHPLALTEFLVCIFSSSCSFVPSTPMLLHAIFLIPSFYLPSICVISQYLSLLLLFMHICSPYLVFYLLFFFHFLYITQPKELSTPCLSRKHLKGHPIQETQGFPIRSPKSLQLLYTLIYLAFRLSL